MNYILCNYIGKFCAVYLDNIAIFSNSVKEHKEHIRLILKALKEYGIVASQSKSILFTDKIEFLGHKISSKGIQANPTKLNKINNYPTPCSVTDIKSFLGLVNYIAMFNFIPGLADYSSVLTDLTKKNVPFTWKSPH
jgi:Reverse transcriptase (RNA-dependent DNA polymerase)